MRIWVYSSEKKKMSDIGWERDGINITYEESSYYRKEHSRIHGKVRKYYILSFDYTFSYDQDEVFFAYSHPYPYTQTCNMIQCLEVNFYNNIARYTLTR
jgi:hypothetical protein